jgi:outer membrane protein assembly factor BamB
MRNLLRAAVIAAATLLAAACAPATLSPSPGLHATDDQQASPSLPALPPLADVPEYRGNSARTGIYPGPGPVSEPQRVWSRTAAGGIEFNPLLWSGNLLFGTLGGHFYSVDARTGELRWDFAGGDEPLGEVRGSGSVADGVVVFSTGDGILHGLDATSATELWSLAGAGAGISDIVAGTVYSAGTDRQVHGLELRTGEQTWSWSAPDDVNGITVDGGVAYVSVLDGRLYAIALEDGRELWHHQTISREAGIAVVGEDVVFISALEGQSAEPTGEIYALERATGRVIWNFRGQSGRQVSLGAIGVTAMYAGSVADGLWAFPIDGGTSDTVQALWHRDTAGSIWKNAALVGEILYLPQSEPGALVAVAAQDGAELWHLQLGGAAQGPVVSGGMLFVADATGVISGYAEAPVKAAIHDATSGAIGTTAPSSTPAGGSPFEVVATFDSSSTSIDTPLDMDVGPDGLLYVLDTKPSVTVLDPATGKPVRTWGRQGTGQGEFDLTRPDDNPGIGAIAVGPDGKVFVGDGANHRIQVFQANGTFVRQFGSFGTGEGQFSRVFHLDAGPDGSVYAVDHDLHYLSKFDPDGEFAWRVGGEGETRPELQRTLQGVTVGPDGLLTVFGEGVGVALVLDPRDGELIRTWGIHGSELGQLEGTVSTFDAEGRIYVESWGVQIYDAAGKFLGGVHARTNPEVTQPPVFAPDGYGYVFGEEGLLRVEVTVPTS